MSNEKMKILKMLEDGRITSDEAARLLSSIDIPAVPASPPESRAYREDPRAYGASNNGGPRPSFPGPRSGSDSFDDFAADLGRKFETFARDMQPKLQKLTEAVVEKTSDMAEKISKSLVSESPPRGSATPVHATSPSGRQGIVKNFETSVTPGYNELSMAALNGELSVKGYNGDKITAKLFYQPKRANAQIEIMQLGSKYYLNYDEDEFEFVNIDAFVPEKLFNVINLSDMNGNVDAASLSADSIFISNSNGKTDVARVRASNVKLDINNGKLVLSELIAEKGIIENFNGTTEGYAVDIKDLKLTGFNGGLSLNIGGFAAYTDYTWVLETSNGKMALNLPTLPELAYYIKAHSSFGSIRIGLTGLSYTANETTYTEAKSIHYDRASKTVRLSLETSNGSLVVN